MKLTTKERENKIKNTQEQYNYLCTKGVRLISQNLVKIEKSLKTLFFRLKSALKY